MLNQKRDLCSIPLDTCLMWVGTALVDIVLANGIFNLNSARRPIYRELARVVRGCSRVYPMLSLSSSVSRLQVATALMV